MPFISRRRFCISVALAPLLVPLRDGFAAPPEAKTNELPVETLVGVGTRMLKEGRTFEKAVAHFAQALEKQPDNAEYALALGCAYASRAASLAWAGAFAERLADETATLQKAVKELPDQVAAMRQKLKDKNADEAEIKKFEAELEEYKQHLKPPPVTVIRIKDDKAPYKLTRPELTVRLTELNQKALAAWGKGVSSSKTDDEKARAHTVRSWGMRLLQFYLSDDEPWRLHLIGRPQIPSQYGYRYKIVPLEIKGLPTDAQIKTALEDATKIAPGTALYWQARADILASKEQGKTDAEITDLYRRAATLDPKNANLWVRIYDREAVYRPAEKQADAPLVLVDLHKAQARDKGNAWYGYEEAGRELINGSWDRSTAPPQTATEKQKPPARKPEEIAAGKRAVLAMERANALPRFAPPRYVESVPNLLARAWRYAPSYWHDDSITGGDATVTSVSRFQNMAWTARQYAQSLQTDQKNEAESLRVLRVLLQAGARVTGDPLPEADRVSEENYARSLFVIAGWTLGNSAYNGLLKIVTSERDPDAHAAFFRESAAWEKRFQDWSAQMPQDETTLIYQIYDRA